MVTLRLLNQHEREKGESSNEEEEEEEEEERPQSASGQSQAPLNRERREPPMVPSEQVVQEAAPLPPQALPAPQDDAQRREGEPSEAEARSEIKEPACLPSRRALGPPTSTPPAPPGLVTVDSEGEEALAASPLGDACVGEQESSTRLPLTSDPEKVDPLAAGPESPGGEPQAPELQKDEDGTSSAAPSREPHGTEAASAAVGAVPGSEHRSQHPRCVPWAELQEQGGCVWRLSLVFPGLVTHPQSLAGRFTYSLIHSFIHTSIRNRLCGRHCGSVGGKAELFLS